MSQIYIFIVSEDFLSPAPSILSLKFVDSDLFGQMIVHLSVLLLLVLPLFQACLEPQLGVGLEVVLNPVAALSSAYMISRLSARLPKKNFVR